MNALTRWWVITPVLLVVTGAWCSGQDRPGANLVARGIFCVGGEQGTGAYAGSQSVLGNGIGYGRQTSASLTNRLGVIATRDNPPFLQIPIIEIPPLDESGYAVTHKELRRRLRPVDPDRQAVSFLATVQEGVVVAGTGEMGEELRWTLPAGVRPPPATTLQISAFDGANTSVNESTIIGTGFHHLVSEMLTPGAFTIRFAASTNRFQLIEQSSVLGKWIGVGFATNTRAMRFEFTDTNPPSPGFRFYRVIEFR